MLKFKLFIVFLCITFWVSQVNSAPSLIADVITVTDDGNIINADGNVEITYKNVKLNAESISYNKLTDEINAQGPIKFFDGQQSVIFADKAKFDQNFKDAVLSGAKFILSESLTITSEKIIRKNGNQNNFYDNIASTCQICAKNQTPLWEIRAKRIYHDEKSKQIYFYKSQFRFWGIPIAYLPLLRLPDPSVKRSKGFLSPDLSYSKFSSTKIALPYFIPLTDASDIIISPSISSNGTYSLGFNYRQLFSNSDLNFDIFGLNSTYDNTLNGYLFSNFDTKLTSNRKLSFQYQRTSNPAFLDKYTDKQIEFTNSHLEISEIDSSFYAYSGIYNSVMQNSEINHSLMPNLNFKSEINQFFKPPRIGGYANLSISADGYQRKSTNDILGRDAVVTNFNLDWHKNKLTDFGGILGVKSFTSAGLSKYYNDTENPNIIGHFRQVAGVDFSLPMAMTDRGNSIIYKPKIQLVYSPPHNPSNPNENSQHTEVSYSNFYDLNQSYGVDNFVSGLQFKTGFETSYWSEHDYKFDLFIGNLNRINGNDTFATGSGLEGITSNNIGSIKLNIGEKIFINSDFSANSSLKLTRNNIQITYKEKDADIYSNLFYKPKNESFGITEDRSELNFGTKFNLSKRTKADLSFIYNTRNNSTVSSRLNSQYKHDCMTVDFYVSRDFNSTGSDIPGISLGFKIELLGLGADQTNKNRISGCNK